MKLIVLIMVLVGLLSWDSWDSAMFLSLAEKTVDNIAPLSQLAEYQITDVPIAEIDFSHDGNSLLLVQDDGVVVAWDIESHTQVALSSPVRLANGALDTQNMILACQCENKSPVSDVRVIDLESGDELIALANFGLATGIAFSDDGSRFIVEGGWTRQDSTAQVWDIAQERLLLFVGREDWTSEATFNPHNRDVVAVGLSKYQLRSGMWLPVRTCSHWRSFFPSQSLGDFSFEWVILTLIQLADS
jgi:WD40 repeat protein